MLKFRRRTAEVAGVMKKTNSKELANIPMKTVCYLTDGREISQTILVLEGSTIDQIQVIADCVGRELCGGLFDFVEVEL